MDDSLLTPVEHIEALRTAQSNLADGSRDVLADTLFTLGRALLTLKADVEERLDELERAVAEIRERDDSRVQRKARPTRRSPETPRIGTGTPKRAAKQRPKGGKKSRGHLDGGEAESPQTPPPSTDL